MESEEVINLQNVWIVMPAFNAANTLEKTYFDIPLRMRRNVLLVDDGSNDETVFIAKTLGLIVTIHKKNLGYGANQKTCYRQALDLGAEVIIMIHPDYQYDARCAAIMAELILLGNCDVVLGNRIRTRNEALSGGMPKWKYFLNRASTLVENVLLGQNLGDWHSGLRAYSKQALEKIPFESNSDDFRFDQQLLIQCVSRNLKIGDIPVPVRYFSDSSSINLTKSLKYGLGGIISVVSYLVKKYTYRRPSK